jgi:KTSC domain-containing protein
VTWPKVSEMPRVESSMIRRIEYEEAPRELEITFTSGRTYVYFGVPKSVYERFLKATSKGQFFNDYIKDQYGFR